MIIDYSKIEKIQFLNYEIDDKININFLKTFEKIYYESLNKKLDFIITGGLAFMLSYNKIYRSLTDIDLLIDPTDIKKWLDSFLKMNSNFCFEDAYEGKPEQRLKDFLMKKISSLVFYDTEFQSKIELININLTNSKKYFILKKNEVDLKIKLPEKIFEAKKIFQREKDIDDYIFYSKYFESF